MSRHSRTELATFDHSRFRILCLCGWESIVEESEVPEGMKIEDFADELWVAHLDIEETT